MKVSYNKITLLITLFLVITSCVSKEQILYLQNVEGVEIDEIIVNFEPKIQIGDILSINVSADDDDLKLSRAFNLYETASITNPKPLAYLVNADGEINFPIFGKIKVKDLTTKEITNNLTQKIKKEYLKNPIVIVRLKNFKITVLGEVKKPGAYMIENERVSIIEAIGLAGDLTIKGERETVKLIREENGKRKMITIDLTSQKLFNSPYFYLAQNDVLIINPNSSLIKSSALGANTSIIFTSIGSLISIIAILSR